MARKSTIIKRCQHCRKSKSLSDYYRNRTKTDGHNGICKECQLWVNSKKNGSHQQNAQNVR